MSKIADVQLPSKASILAEEGYSYSVIGDKLGRSKGWVAKWVERSKQGELGDHARCGRPKILTQAAIRIIKKAKYRRGFGLRQIEKSLKAGGPKSNKETIRNYLKVEVKWRCWKRRKASLLTDARGKKGCYSRGSIDIGNSKTDVMFYLVTNRRIKCSMFQTHAVAPFGVRKKKMFLSPRRSSLVRLFLCGEL